MTFTDRRGSVAAHVPVPRAHPMNRAVTLGVVCLATAMLMLDIAVVNTALPAIAREFSSGLTGLKWVVDGYIVSLAALVLAAGGWSDRFGRRRVLGYGTIIFTIASIVCAAAGGMGVLVGARIVQGVGAALLFASSLAVLADAFPGTERARALAAYGATIGASFAVGPLVGGVLTESMDWRAVFALNVPVGAMMLVGMRWVRESRSIRPRQGDRLGQVLVIVALGTLTYGVIGANDRGWADTVTLSALGIAVVSTTAFIMVERRVREPMLPLSMFANPAFAGAQIATFAISASMFAVFVYVTIYLQAVTGLSPIGAGLVYLPGTVAMLMVAAATDKMAGRVAPWVLLTGSLLAVGAGLALMTVAGLHSTGWAMMPGFLLSCIGAGVFNPVMSGLVLQESADDDAGLAAGINDMFRQSGIAIGVAVLGALFPMRSVLDGGMPAPFVEALQLSLWVAAATALAGALVCALSMRRVPIPR